MNRNSTLDMLKGLGIFLVVLGHATFVNEKIITYVFSFHMPLFFIVSGVLMSLTYKDNITIKAFLTKKLKSIAIPYLCFSICYTVIDFFSVYFRQISLQDLKINAVCTLSLAGSGPLWFLPTLFCAELILFLLIILFKKISITQNTNNTDNGFKLKAIVGTLGCICGILGLIGCYFLRPIYETNKDSLVTLFFMNFLVVILRSMLCQIFLVPGYLLADYANKLSNASNKKAPWCQFIIGCTLLAIDFPLSLLNTTNPDLHNMNFGNPVVFIVCAYVGTIGLFLICSGAQKIKLFSIELKDTIVSKLIQFWGKNSLVIMITHLNFYFLYVGNLVAVAINPYITHAKSYIFLFNILWVAMLLSSLVALLINKFFPWMIGKKKHFSQQ